MSYCCPGALVRRFRESRYYPFHHTARRLQLWSSFHASTLRKPKLYAATRPFVHGFLTLVASTVVPGSLRLHCGDVAHRTRVQGACLDAIQAQDQFLRTCWLLLSLTCKKESQRVECPKIFGFFNPWAELPLVQKKLQFVTCCDPPEELNCGADGFAGPAASGTFLRCFQRYWRFAVICKN